MLGLSINSIKYVLIRNYMSFRHLFKISIFPNLMDPVLFLLSMGLGLSGLVGDINGISYLLFVTSGLIAATGMNASSNEVLTNAYIQMYVERTYSLVAMTPVNIQDVVIGQVIWASLRSVIFGAMFLVIAIIISGTFNWTVLLIPFVLFISGFLFAIFGISFTMLISNRDFLNYYSIIILRPMYMFSDTFFPISQMPTLLQDIAWFSPLYHATNLCRALLSGDVNGLYGHLIWLLIAISVFVYLPLKIASRKLLS